MQISHPWGPSLSGGLACPGDLEIAGLAVVLASSQLLCWRAAGSVGVSSCRVAMNLIAAGGGEAEAAAVGHVHGLTGLEQAGQGRWSRGERHLVVEPVQD